MTGPTSLVLRIIAFILILAAAWLLWSGFFKPLLLALGLFSCILSAYIAYRTGFFREVTGLHVIPRLPRYWFWLLKEIVKSSIDVARIVLDPKLPVNPKVITLDASRLGSIGQVILGNSITLSPGTVTIDLYNDKVLVHCLTEQGAEELAGGEFIDRSADVTPY